MQILSRKSLAELRIHRSVTLRERLHLAIIKHVLTCSIGGMHIRKHYQYKASHTNSNANELPQPVLCLQEDPSEHNDTWNWPAIQEHHTRQGCVLISLHNCGGEELRKAIQFSIYTRKENETKLRKWLPSLHSLMVSAYRCSWPPHLWCQTASSSTI